MTDRERIAAIRARLEAWPGPLRPVDDGLTLAEGGGR